MGFDLPPVQVSTENLVCKPDPTLVCKDPVTTATSNPVLGPAFENAVNGDASQTAGFAVNGGFVREAPVRGLRSQISRTGDPQCELTKGAFIGMLQQLRASGQIISNTHVRDIIAMVEVADQRGLLDRTDSQGISLLQHLQTIATTPVDPALENKMAGTPATPGHVLLTVLTNLTDADATMGIQQRESTCASKVLEYMMAKQDPSGYAGLVGNLAAGRNATGVDGSTLTLDRTALTTETSARNMASRLFQASVSHTMITNWLGNHTYTNADTDMVKGRGLDQDEAGKAAKALLGPGWTTHSGQPDLTTLRLPALAGIGWHMDADEVKSNSPSNGHAVMIERVENGRVYFRDPGETKEIGKTVQADGQNYGPKRQGEGGTLFSMPAADFAELVNYYSQGPATP